jgi:Family of unknown function (DUF6302)
MLQNLGWSTDEERNISSTQHAESAPRAEAIRRMQRRRKASRLAIDRAWYAARLDESWLLDLSIPLRREDSYFVLAVPVGGHRQGGHVSFPSPKYAEQAAERLKGNAGFPNVRIERSRERGVHHVVRWGENEPSVTQHRDQANAQIAQQRAAGEFFGYSDSAIRGFLFEQFEREAVLAVERLCRNPRCTRGDDHGPGSLAHLRADTRYCDDTCKKAGQRSLRRENEVPNRQCLCGSKRDKSVSVALPLNGNVYAL